MPTWIETYLGATNPLFYPAVFLALLLAGLAFPISADLVLLTVGYLAYRGQAEYVILIPLCISAILISDTMMFVIGRKLGIRMLRVWPLKKVITAERMASAEASFRTQGYRVVFLARFMPGVRTVFMFTSGVLGLRYVKFILYNFLGAIIVVPGMIYSLRFAAGNKDAILAAIHRGQWYLLSAVTIFAIYYFFVRNRIKASSKTRSNPASLQE